MLKDDVIFEVDGAPVRGEGMQVVENFSAMIRARGPGGKMNLTVLRGAQEIPMLVTIGRCPEEIAKQGTVRTVSENHFKASAKFPKWWAKYFIGPSAQRVTPGATSAPTRN
jgi:C-terminal processing protease CtpA/Prc